MQKAVLEAVDEELAHMSPIARCVTSRVDEPECAVEFSLVAITHRVSGIGDIQRFWPPDLSLVRPDVQASVKEQSGEQTLVFRYNARGAQVHGRASLTCEFIILTMADGSTRSATLHGATLDYDVPYSFVYHQKKYPAVSADMLEAAIKAHDLTLLKATIKTANHLNMGNFHRPIHAAIQHNQHHILEWLIAQPGIDVNKLPMESIRPIVQHLFRFMGSGSQEHFHTRCLCTLLRAGATLVVEDPYSEFHMFHWLAGTSESDIAYLMAQEDIMQKLLEYSAYAFEPSKKTGRLVVRYKSISPAFVDLLRRAENMLWLAVSVHIPVSALTTVIVSYIIQP
jgi:hypothetical protein